MGDFRGTMLIFGVFIYFTVFILIVNASAKLDAENIDISDIPNKQDTSYIAFTNDHLCNSPRLRYDPDTGESKAFTGGYLALIDCDNSRGIYSSDDCSQLKGCSWDNVTTKTLWQKIFGGNETYETCTGNIDVESYNINVSSETLSAIAEYEPLNLWENDDETSANICRHPAVITNISRCELFSCSWDEFDYSSRYNNPTKLINTMGTVFSFKHDFGVTDQSAKNMLSLFLIVLPLILLAIGIYMSIPVING